MAEFDSHFSFSSLIIIPVLAIGLWLLLRKIVFIQSDSVTKNLPASATQGCKKSRLAEAIMLLCCGGIILIFTATNRSTCGRLLVLDELNPEFAAVNLIVAICAGVGLLASVLVCLLWRTAIATILVAFVLIVYATLLNGHKSFLEDLAGPNANQRQVSWTIQTEGCDIEGAELWVNGVQLGTLPFTITPDEFKAKVPFWPEPPVGFETREGGLKIAYYSLYGPMEEHGHRSWSRWAEIIMPAESTKRWGGALRNEGTRKARTYYAQVKYDGQWGYCQTGGGGGDGGGYIYHVRSGIRARFPDREKRIETLLDKARLADYKPDTAWFDTADTFGEDVVIALRKAVPKEPQMEDMLALWAQHRYKLLEQLNNETSAWQAFEAICNEADREGIYSTSSIAGKAVELLAPQLPPKALADKAIKLIRSTRYYPWALWTLAGKKHFGGRTKSAKPLRLTTGYEGYGGGGNQLPISAYAVTHAAWKMDEYLDEKEPQKENIIEREVVPEFLAQNYLKTSLIRLAAVIGSSKLDQYLLKQDWRASVENSPYHQIMRPVIGGDEVNGWLYLLMNLDTPVGQKFRMKHKQKCFDLANVFVGDYYSRHDGNKGLDFLFYQNNLARGYWPYYLRAMTKVRNPEDKLYLSFQYLSKIEPHSKVQDYVHCWRQAQGNSTDNILGMSDFKGFIPKPKREQIVNALIEAVNHSEFKPKKHRSIEQIKKSLIGQIKLLGQSPSELAIKRAEHILDVLHTGKKNDIKPEYVKSWLANVAPDHPLIEMLVADENPKFRVFVLDAIVNHPTPKNRTILKTLLNDPNPQVQSAAKISAEKLKSIH